MQTSRRMREELECAVAEKQESERRLKKALPRLEKLHAEEMRLRAGLEQEAEACAAQRSQLKEECLELTKAKDLLQKQRRLLKAEAEKCERLTLEASEAESQRRAAQVDLAKCQRLRQEEHKRWVAEREVLRRGLSPPRRQLSRSPPRRGADAPGDRLLVPRQAWTSLRAIASFLKVALTKPEDHPQVLHEEEDLLVAWKPPKMSMKRPKGGLSEFEAWAHGLDRWVPRSPLLGRGIGGVVLLAREPGDSWKPEATLALLVQGEPSQATLDAAVGGPLRSLRVITASEGLHLGRLSLLEGELLPGRSEKEVRALLAELGHRIIGNGQLCARAAGVRRTFLASVGVRHEAGAFLLAPPPSFQRLLQTDAAALERRSASNWHGRTEHHAGCAVFDGLDLEVPPGVFVPRRSGLPIVEAASKGAPCTSNLRILDCGTGSGCLALALLARFPSASAVAIDADPLAQRCAARNAERLGLPCEVLNLRFAEISRSGLGPFDLAVSNPPYLPRKLMEHVGFARELQTQSLSAFAAGEERHSGHWSCSQVPWWSWADDSDCLTAGTESMMQQAMGDHDLSLSRTEYQRIANARSFAGEPAAWQWTGKPWTLNETLRQREARQGCGITPRVYPAPLGTVNEELATSRTTMQYATMALSAQAGHIMRKRELDDTDRLRSQQVLWEQHDHDLSAGRKERRPFPIAGRSSASLGYTKKPTFMRTQINGDRPSWMKGDDELPGGWSFSPHDPQRSSRFAREVHFTSSFKGSFQR
ncbi:unnamed protein product [Effrenium voratum]|nr:unnamed protein product [Effrenium voratum]